MASKTSSLSLLQSSRYSLLRTRSQKSRKTHEKRVQAQSEDSAYHNHTSDECSSHNGDDDWLEQILDTCHVEQGQNGHFPETTEEEANKPNDRDARRRPPVQRLQTSRTSFRVHLRRERESYYKKKKSTSLESFSDC